MEKRCGVEVSKILEFPATQGFGKWKPFFPDESTAHPAKINLNLLNYLILKYTEEGDTILDCMSGSGSTGVLSALNGRNAILIELEEKFCKWIREAKKKVEQQQTLTKKGKIVVIQGDARNIPGLIKEHTEEISSIITSPPFAGTSGGKGEKSRSPINERYPGVFDRCIGGNKGALSEDPKQIDNLKYVIVDNIISSPPFGNRLADGELGDDDERGRMKYSSAGAGDVHNIGFLPLLPQADSIIFLLRILHLKRVHRCRQMGNTHGETR
jgi:DNA modification methylase